MSDTVVVQEVSGKKDRHDFITLPWRLYRDDPNWVPPLFQDMHNTLDPRKNALLRLGPYRFFLARRNGVTVGRLGVGMDLRLNQSKGENLSYITLFESVNDYAV
ncbi:MAG: N-acetyltransferase, partial [Firmicutes bacterium]|nr:N-acetyltransferase [Bacillota bacterium]